MDLNSNEHIRWFKRKTKLVKTGCGKKYQIFEFLYDDSQIPIMSAWAKHFRNQYCLDSEIDILRPSNLSRKNYLLSHKFPDASAPPGPSIRSGDFGEILVADYLRFIRDYYVPSTRYRRKAIRNESVKGSDVVAFKFGRIASKDELIVYEVKASLSNGGENRMQEAVDHSMKDAIRIGEALQTMRERMYDSRDLDGFEKVARFQDQGERPFIQKYGAASVVNKKLHSIDLLEEVSTEKHEARDQLELLVIYADDFMDLAHSLYERAANEA